MEINLNNEFVIIKDKEITGVLNNDNFKKLVDLSNKKICYIDNYNFLTKTVSDEFFLRKKDIQEDNNYIDKIISCLNLIGLNKDYLEREIITLSVSEKILLMIGLSLITNPDIIIFDNIFNNLDKNNKNKIKRLILNLKKEYKKTIIIIDNINILYELCNYLIIFKDNNIIINDSIKNILNDINILIDNNIELPFLIEFSNISQDYNKKIKYHNSINDLIKDVYKNAK